ncbi:hypothetical protein HZA85_00425 [Candidatus Uhrbacteria bacterium]|nr:hypothetical protein [Candidatus Uhrbacteria bacterium]
MSPLFRIPLGLAVMVVGFLMVQKTETLLNWFGSVPFAEEKFGPGGSRFFYKLIGILVVFIGIFIATNIISNMLESVARVLTNT